MSRVSRWSWWAMAAAIVIYAAGLSLVAQQGGTSRVAMRYESLAARFAARRR